VASRYRLTREQLLLKPTDEVFSFFLRPESLQEITPPFLGFHISHADSELHTGSLIQYRLRVRGFPMRWTSEMTEWNPPHRLVDSQIRGPYSLWRHQHSFTSEMTAPGFGMRSSMRCHSVSSASWCIS
jgi:ligand-binding SRPBCC domain-containing protein